MDPTHRSTRDRKDRLIGKISTSSIFLLTVLVAFGCSVEKNYKVLSFFFDGVPEPGSQRAGGPGGDGGGIFGGEAASAHLAYVERRCNDCHGDTGNFGFVVEGFQQLDSRACARCHSEVLSAHQYIHGPVAAAECLWCHNAHESAYPSLLTMPGPELCLGCHSEEMFGSPRPPEHMDLTRNCLECHQGHGGENASLLRPDYGQEPEAEPLPETTEDTTAPAPDTPPALAEPTADETNDSTNEESIPNRP